MGTTNQLSPIQWAAVIAIGLAGLVHIIIAPAHWQLAPAHGLFFVMAGLVELGWAIAYFSRPSFHLTLVGIGLAAIEHDADHHDDQSHDADEDHDSQPATPETQHP